MKNFLLSQILVFFLIHVILACVNSQGQSGGKITSPLPYGDDAYNLIFARSYRGKNFTVGDEEARQGRASRLENFSTQLNVGNEPGYKLISVLNGWNPIAIVKADEILHEYDWFETTSSVRFAKSGFREKLAKMAEQSFRVVDHFFISQSCEFLDQENPTYGEKCIYKDLFLFEKKKGSKELLQQILIGSVPGWGNKPSVEMASEIDEKLAEGFYPVIAISKFEILLERAKDKDDILNDKPDVQVVRSEWGDSNLQKKINELAKQGYRLAMTNNGIAVMYRNSETSSIPVSYIWLRTDKQNFEKELVKLQENGAVYRTTYPTDKGSRNTLIFEQNLNGKGKRAEWRVLSFEFNSVENEAEGKVYVDLTPSSKEAVKMMNQLAKQGFVVRDLFDSGKASVILERTR